MKIQTEIQLEFFMYLYKKASLWDVSSLNCLALFCMPYSYRRVELRRKGSWAGSISKQTTKILGSEKFFEISLVLRFKSLKFDKLSRATGWCHWISRPRVKFDDSKKWQAVILRSWGNRATNDAMCKLWFRIEKKITRTGTLQFCR